MQEELSCEHCKTKQRSEEEYKTLMNRLSRIEGQVRGLKGMVEKNAYCPDIIIQVEAVKSALGAFGRELLSNHIQTCVLNDMKNGKEETLEELITLLKRIM